MFEGYTESEKSNVKEVFSIFARESGDEKRGSENVLNFHELKCAMRALGFDPGNRETMQIMEKCDPIQKRRVNFQQFEREMAILFKNRDPMQEIERAFRLFAGENEVITFDSLKAVSKELGEFIEDEELMEMIKEFDLDQTDSINLDEFARICGH